jgi:hypothetical protein
MGQPIPPCLQAVALAGRRQAPRHAKRLANAPIAHRVLGHLCTWSVQRRMRKRIQRQLELPDCKQPRGVAGLVSHMDCP